MIAGGKTIPPAEPVASKDYKMREPLQNLADSVERRQPHRR